MKSSSLLEEFSGRTVDWRTWRQLFRYSLRYRRSVVGLAIAAVATAGTDAAFPLVTLRLVDELIEKGAAADLASHAWAYFGLLILLCTCILAFIMLAGRLSTHVAHDIRAAGFARLQELSFSYYDQRPVGWLMARMTSDCDRLARILAWGLLDVSS